MLQVELQSRGCGLGQGGLAQVALHLKMNPSFQSARKVDYKSFIIAALPFIYMPASPQGSTARAAWNPHDLGHRKSKSQGLGSWLRTKPVTLTKCLDWAALPSLPRDWDDNDRDLEEGHLGPRFWNLGNVPVLRLWRYSHLGSIRLPPPPVWSGPKFWSFSYSNSSIYYHL